MRGAKDGGCRGKFTPSLRYHQHALTKTLHASNPLWTPALSAGTLYFDRDEHLIFALQNGWVENNPDDFKTLSGAAIAYPPRTGSDRVTAIMRQQIARHEGNAARQVVWLKAFAAIASAEDLPFVLARGGTNAVVIEARAGSPGLRRSPPADAAQMLSPLMRSRDDALREQAVRLVGIWKVAAFADEANPDEAAKIVLKRLGAVRTPSEAAPLLQALLNRNEGSLTFQSCERHSQGPCICAATR